VVRGSAFLSKKRGWWKIKEKRLTKVLNRQKTCIHVYGNGINDPIRVFYLCSMEGTSSLWPVFLTPKETDKAGTG
jgi:hypothetical protein